jgi:hypothetical protein
MWKWIIIMSVIFICNVCLASSDKTSEIKLTGVWHGYYYNYEVDDEDEFEMTLKQKGKNITGSMEDNGWYGNEYGDYSPYSISGKIKGDIITSFKIIPMDNSFETKEYTGVVDDNQSVMDLTNVDDPSDTRRFIKQYVCDKIIEE